MKCSPALRHGNYIELTKHAFKSRVLDFIMAEMDKDKDATAPELVKKVTLLNAILCMVR